MSIAVEMLLFLLEATLYLFPVTLGRPTWLLMEPQI